MWLAEVLKLSANIPDETLFSNGFVDFNDEQTCFSEVHEVMLKR